MKKILVLVVLAMFLAAPAFAASSTLITPATGSPTTATIGGSVFQCSTLVTLIYEATAVAYTADSGHLNGDKGFWTTSVDPSITNYDKAKGTAVSALTTAIGDVGATSS